jgi:hypothetical protein
MRTRAKRLPRLWCALQGLLPLEDCLAAQRGELAWPVETAEPLAASKVEKPAGGVDRSPSRRATR